MSTPTVLEIVRKTEGRILKQAGMKLMEKLKKILIIDDDEITVHVTKALLEDLDISEKIDAVTDGKLGLEYLLRHCEIHGNVCPQMVILDDHMPEMDGLEMMKALNAINFDHDIIFLLIGVNTREEDAVEFRQLGVHEIALKPISKETVVKAYHRYWNNKAEINEKS